MMTFDEFVVSNKRNGDIREPGLNIYIRVITVKAETLEEAQEKYAAGEWEDDQTINFYAEEELEPLKEVKETA